MTTLPGDTTTETLETQREVVVGNGIKLEVNEAGQLVLSAEPFDNGAREAARIAQELASALELRVPLIYQTHQVILWDASLTDTDKYGPRDELYAFAHYVGPADPETVGRVLTDADLWTNDA